MPYFLETDTFHDLPVWEVLADGAGDLVDALQAAYVRMKSKASHLLTEGYLTEGAALAMCRNRRRILDKLCTGVLGDQPLLHRRGDDCECLGETWTDGYAYRIHNFLKRNPSRREYNRNRAQKADLRDARLKAVVFRRDGGCCRYCRSGRLSAKAVRSKDRRKVLHFDHVDPDQPAGPDGTNFVTCCARCNETKGRRTPDEADMVLLPPPDATESAAWMAAPMELHDNPPAHRTVAGGALADHHATSTGSATDHRITHRITDHEQKPVADPTTEPVTDHQRDPITDPALPVHPAPTTPAPEHRSAQAPEPSGMGRGRAPGLIPASRTAAQEHRPPEDPDVYHRRSRLPDPPAYISAIPEWPPTWPAGAVPATPLEH